MKKLISTKTLFLLGSILYGQIKLDPNLLLPKDSIKTQILLTSLNGFLSQKDSTNSQNTYVKNSDLLETSILLDEFKYIEENEDLNNKNFFKPYLNNVRKIDSLSYFIQLSYIGIQDSTPILSAIFELIATYENGKYYFSSPLRRNTAHWKVATFGKATFHYKTSLNQAKAKEFENYIKKFDEKLSLNDAKIEWYGCKDFNQVLELFGVKYKAEYNGHRVTSGFTATENNTHLIISGNDNESFNEFDPHDLWHSRSKMVIPSEKYSKPNDCGYAHIVGGSWGMSWETIWKMFKERVASDKNKNWLEEYGKWYNFGDSPEKHLRTEYILNGLLCEMIEKKYGMKKVLEFMSIGPYEKTNSNYFKALEQITGITKDTYNEELWKLINSKK